MIENKKVYDPVEIQKQLGLGKTRLYEFLEEVYKNKSPFIVIKVGRLYKIPKEPFNHWINGEI
jgi:hypothetical protein